MTIKKHAKKHLMQGLKALYNNYEKAFLEFSRANRLNPKLAEVYYQLSFFYNGEEKIKALSKAIELKPDYVDAYIMRGLENTCFYKNPKAALVDFNIAISLKPKKADIYLLKARAMKELEQYDKAIINFKKAIYMKVKDQSCLIDLGICYLLKQDFKSATRCFKKTIFKSNNNQYIGEAYKYLAYISIEKQEKHIKAINYFKKSIEFYEKTPFLEAAPYYDLEVIYKYLNENNELQI